MFAHYQIAEDGHKCDSMAEKIIDDYLLQNNIKHERNIPLFMYPYNQTEIILGY